MWLHNRNKSIQYNAYPLHPGCTVGFVLLNAVYAMYLIIHYFLKMLVWAPLNPFHDPLGWWPTEWSKDPVWSVFQDIHEYLVVYVLCLVSEIVSAIFWIREHWRRQEKAGALLIQSPCFGNMLERCSFIYLFPAPYLRLDLSPPFPHPQWPSSRVIFHVMLPVSLEHPAPPSLQAHTFIQASRPARILLHCLVSFGRALLRSRNHVINLC